MLRIGVEFYLTTEAIFIPCITRHFLRAHRWACPGLFLPAIVLLQLRTHWDEIRKKVGVGGMKMEKLLGDSRRIKDTVEFIESTERFDF